MTSILDFAGLLYGSSFDVINIPVHCVFDGMSSLNRKNKLTCAFKIQSAFFDYNHLAPCEHEVKARREELWMFKIRKRCTTFLMLFFNIFSYVTQYPMAVVWLEEKETCVNWTHTVIAAAEQTTAIGTFVEVRFTASLRYGKRNYIWLCILFTDFGGMQLLSNEVHRQISNTCIDKYKVN